MTKIVTFEYGEIFSCENELAAKKARKQKTGPKTRAVRLNVQIVIHLILINYKLKN